MWLSVITFLSAPSAPYLFCGIIILAFLCSLFANWLQLTDVRRSVRRASAILTSVSSPSEFYDRFESFADRFDKEPLFSGPWNEFSKTTVIDTARQLVRSTRRPQEFFNTSSIIAPRLNLRLFSAMPGYLISLGLFFTFIGLVAAIAIAAQGLGKGADVTQTQQALVQLLDVASLKFISSVTGIALSIVLSFVQKSWLNQTMMMLHQFCADLERRTQSITTEQLLHQWLVNQQQAARGHVHLAEDIATEVALQLGQVRA